MPSAVLPYERLLNRAKPDSKGRHGKSKTWVDPKGSSPGAARGKLAGSVRPIKKSELDLISLLGPLAPLSFETFSGPVCAPLAERALRGLAPS